MTPEAQRIAIAEACGWKNVKPIIVKNVTEQGDDRFCGITSDNGWIPDYLNDLNAMHEAEKVLGEFGTPIWRQYQNNIAKGDVAVLCGVIAHATAAQRAEAFLRTLGLWKE